MQILIINYEFPPLSGGAGNATYYLANHLEPAYSGIFQEQEGIPQ
jgi:hypothetical protein